MVASFAVGHDITRGLFWIVSTPVELLAHDPSRYVGDILYVNQSIAAEREFPESLLGFGKALYAFDGMYDDFFLFVI